MLWVLLPSLTVYAQLKSVLQGEKFNMQARAYFAVVTGTSDRTCDINVVGVAQDTNVTRECIRENEREKVGHEGVAFGITYTHVLSLLANDSIEAIRAAERRYFSSSELVKRGVFPSRRAGTDNLSRSPCATCAVKTCCSLLLSRSLASVYCSVLSASSIDVSYDVLCCVTCCCVVEQCLTSSGSVSAKL